MIYTMPTPSTTHSPAATSPTHEPSRKDSADDGALPLLGLMVSEPIVGDGTDSVASVLAVLESCANPTAGGLYWYTLMTFFCGYHGLEGSEVGKDT